MLWLGTLGFVHLQNLQWEHEFSSSAVGKLFAHLNHLFEPILRTLHCELHTKRSLFFSDIGEIAHLTHTPSSVVEYRENVRSGLFIMLESSPAKFVSEKLHFAHELKVTDISRVKDWSWNLTLTGNCCRA